MTRIASALQSCRKVARCPDLPGIAVSLQGDGRDIIVNVAQIVVADTRHGSVARAEQVRCINGVPDPKFFRDSGDPGARWCEQCRAAFGYALLATVYATMAVLCRDDLVLDFSQIGAPPPPVDEPPPTL